MMLGHGLLAFAAVASLAAAAGWDRRRALAIGAVALAFASLPDVDMLYAVWGAVDAFGSNLFLTNEAFWDASDAAHRSATHSLVVAVPAAAAVGVLVRRASGRFANALAVGLLASLSVVGVVTSGLLDGTMLLAFGAGAVTLAAGVRRWTDLGWGPVTAAALFGLWSHPFGDVFTGGPPRFFYPFEVDLLDGKILFSADPTVHLLVVFGLELVAVWLAAATYLNLHGRSVREYVGPQAGFGVVYAGAVFLFPAPSLSVPSVFVFSILAVGVTFALSVLVAGPIRATTRADGGEERPGETSPRFERWLRPLLTGAAAVTVAWFAYFGTLLLR